MPRKTKDNLKKFTYGHQFEPEKAKLDEYLELCDKNSPSRDSLEKAFLNKFFSKHSGGTKKAIADDNQKKLAMNCFLSLRSYQLVLLPESSYAFLVVYRFFPFYFQPCFYLSFFVYYL